MATGEKLGIAKILHQRNLKQHKRIGEDEALEFGSLETPRCEKCGADQKPSLFNLHCPKCEVKNE
jgi:Zn finger protein HypA/HybF involved in hydrogenase expression